MNAISHILPAAYLCVVINNEKVMKTFRLDNQNFYLLRNKLNRVFVFQFPHLVMLRMCC